MKIRTSMKETWRYSHVFRAGYCDLQYIMNGYEPTYYNAGVYGWNNDMYIGYPTNTIITTGYRNMRGERIPDYIVKAFSENARDILTARGLSYEQCRFAIDLNRKTFFNVLADLKTFEKIFDRYARNYLSFSEAISLAVKKGA